MGSLTMGSTISLLISGEETIKLDILRVKKDEQSLDMVSEYWRLGVLEIECPKMCVLPLFLCFRWLM
jgi:hypothetical protein